MGGEGGMALTNNPDVAERCRQLRNLCFDPRKRRFVHDDLGWNYRMTNLQAALGLAQLEHLDAAVARKREVGRLYTDLLHGCPGLVHQTRMRKVNPTSTGYMAWRL